MNPAIVAVLSALLLYIGLYLHRKCENPELFDKNTAMYAMATGVLVFAGLYWYQTPAGSDVNTENVLNTPF